MIETFPRDSLFLSSDTRAGRWAVPYHYEALNARVENLIVKNRDAIYRKQVLDLGCHFGSFAYACLRHGADRVTGIDSEQSLIDQANDLFGRHAVPSATFRFFRDDVNRYLQELPPDSFDTVLCLGLLYYIPDPFHFLELMARASRRYIILDTFTAYYGACIAREGGDIFQSTRPETFELPIMLFPLTQSHKQDYTVEQGFVNSRNKRVSMMTLPSIPALEVFFNLLGLRCSLMQWDEYRVNHFSWQDFIRTEVKENSHWADVYHTKIRVAYVLEKVQDVKK